MIKKGLNKAREDNEDDTWNSAYVDKNSAYVEDGHESNYEFNRDKWCGTEGEGEWLK